MTGGNGSGAAPEAGVQEWFAALVGSLPGLSVYGLGILVVDLGTGEILGATPTVEPVLGAAVPATVDGLVEGGLVARPDLRRLRRQTRDSWRDEVRVHPPDGPARLVHLEVAVHRHGSGAAAAVVTLWPADEEPDLRVGDHVERLDDIWALYDDELRMIAADPAFADLGIDPRSHLGSVAWLYLHPDDIPRIEPLVAGVLDGSERTARYSARLRARDGGWIRAEIEIRRLEAADGPQFIIVCRYVNDARRAIGPDVLTPTQVAVVVDLFDGLKVGQIAERRGIAVKTVRHHLAAVYRRLEVSGQGELLATYHRPAARA